MMLTNRVVGVTFFALLSSSTAWETSTAVRGSSGCGIEVIPFFCIVAFRERITKKPTQCEGGLSIIKLSSRSNRFAAAFAGADADAVLKSEYKYLAVSDGACIARSGSVDNCFNSRFHERLVHGDLELQFRDETNLDLRAAIYLGEAALPAATANIAHCHQVNIALGQGVLDSFELFGPDDCYDQFHGEYEGFNWCSILAFYATLTALTSLP